MEQTIVREDGFLDALKNIGFNFEEQTDGFEEFEEEEKVVKKKNTGSKNKGYGANTDGKLSREHLYESDFAVPLKDSRVREVRFSDHAIRYKESDWKIGARNVGYLLKYEKHPAAARSTADDIGLSKEEQQKIYKGEERIMVMQTYDSVPKEQRVLGYLVLKVDESGRITYDTYCCGKDLHRLGIGSGDVVRYMEEMVREVLGK